MRPNLWAILICILAVHPAGRAAADDRIAIIDTAWDTRPFLDLLDARGVEVVGRYYARCDQWEQGLHEKRLMDQGSPDDPSSEVAQLLERGFAILSIYQYHNNSPAKFEGRTRNGDILPGADCAPATTPHDVRTEAQLDAEAAVAQARRLGQPTGTAIYFGVDFALSDIDRATQERIVVYFQEVRQILDAAGYRLGAYGSGLAQTILQDAQTADGRRPLIQYSWLSASRAFAGTSRVHRSGNWHLFQNQVNREWFAQASQGKGCTRGLAIDTNVQNASRAGDIGFWTMDGSYTVDVARTEAIQATRRFACDGDAILRRTRHSGVSDLAEVRACAGGQLRVLPSRIDFANSARLGETHADRVQVDIDDDGQFDGWTWAGNMTPDFASKPDWIFNPEARRRRTCN